MQKPKYKKILLKLSGESFKGSRDFGFDGPTINFLADEIAGVHSLRVEIGIVIGGGNIFRGGKNDLPEINRAVADYIGMTATVINALILQAVLEKRGIETHIMSAIESGRIIEFFNIADAVGHLRKGNIMIFAGGTGNPFFTTDSAAILRAIEIEANVVLKGTNVEGVYSADPKTCPNACFYHSLSFDEVIHKNLKVMDLTAFTMAQENNIPIIVFNITEKGNLRKAVCGEPVGTIIE